MKKNIIHFKFASLLFIFLGVSYGSEVEPSICKGENISCFTDISEQGQSNNNVIGEVEETDYSGQSNADLEPIPVDGILNHFDVKQIMAGG